MVLVRVVAAAALVLTGVIHLDLAGSYDRSGDAITVGALFRGQGVLALLVAGLLLLRRDRLPVVGALLLALASTAAVVLSVYVQVPALGPLPELYEPVWYTQKALSAGASAVAAVLAAVLLRCRRTLP